MYNYSDFPIETVEDLVRIRRRIASSGLPAKHTDFNLLVGSWNIRALGRVQPTFEESNRSPKRNLRALASIAEVIRRFDVIAIQEVKRDTTALRTLMDDFLGPDWGLILSDVTAGSGGNTEVTGVGFSHLFKPILEEQELESKPPKRTAGLVDAPST